MTIPAGERVLRVVMYHYVRDFAKSPFPHLKGMPLEAFDRQLDALGALYEMATLESALAFLAGYYRPKRDLCLLTFDDGLAEHVTLVTPLLAARRIQGLFFLITSCVEEQRVAPVHMNHFLMAQLGFRSYAARFERLLAERLAGEPRPAIDPVLAARTYPWDAAEVAAFKYLFNFGLEFGLRDAVVGELFRAELGDESSFARALYVSWQQARYMQRAGMLLGGHTHRHQPLATLDEARLRSDLETCHELLCGRLAPQSLWPFCYPYGKQDSFDARAVQLLKRLGFCCSFSTESGPAEARSDLFAIRRLDCNRLPLPPAAA
jgi:peptidoglycan/xylan/chitin deacetylase (PgdA/CDA1 family)